MVNKEIARHFSLLANLLELHGENAFKTKAYSSAYLVLRKWDRPLDEMTPAEIDAIPGIGSSVIAKIKELQTTGKIEALETVKAKTPEGIQQLLSVRGLGPKKIRVIWDALNLESPAELLYACHENRLVKLPGFGLKTQEDLKQKIEYFLDSQDRYLFGQAEEELSGFINKIRIIFPAHRIEWVGEYATFTPVLSKLECLLAPKITGAELDNLDRVELQKQNADGSFDIRYDERYLIKIHTCDENVYWRQWCMLTMEEGMWKKIEGAGLFDNGTGLPEVLEMVGHAELPLELMDRNGIVDASPELWSGLITASELKGILHNHSTWSDGIHTLEEMAVHVRDQGYAYFAICDHSRSAFYAQGLSVERVMQQMEEIDALNVKLAPFKIFKGIESDILGDGSLDYEEDILSKFDLVVASVHSNLRMDESKAMSRLIKAVENSYTRILGHPTGRLLLARQGYPIDHRKIIDACAANGVAIELNANPLRLDIDYQWLEYCMQKEVWVSINPDAHSRGQIDYVRYGVFAARKGGLKSRYCLNALSLDDFSKWVEEKVKDKG